MHSDGLKDGSLVLMEADWESEIVVYDDFVDYNITRYTAKGEIWDSNLTNFEQVHEREDPFEFDIVANVTIEINNQDLSFQSVVI